MAELLNVIGDVRGKRAIIVDDEIDTASTLMEIERALIREGVTEIYACATHGVLSDPAIDRLRNSEITEVVITDTIPLPPAKQLPRIKVLSVAPLIGEAIRRIHRGESVGALFSEDLSSSRRCSCGMSRTATTTTKRSQKRRSTARARMSRK